MIAFHNLTLIESKKKNLTKDSSIKFRQNIKMQISIVQKRVKKRKYKKIRNTVLESKVMNMEGAKINF